MYRSFAVEYVKVVYYKMKVQFWKVDYNYGNNMRMVGHFLKFFECHANKYSGNVNAPIKYFLWLDLTIG